MNTPPKTKEERSQCCGANKVFFWKDRNKKEPDLDRGLVCFKCHKPYIPQDQEECICYEQERNGEFNFKCSKCNRLVFSRLISSPDLKESGCAYFRRQEKKRMKYRNKNPIIKRKSKYYLCLIPITNNK